ncbi:MAG: sulfite exporter TauE/SafE family protein [Betaproteobacteria bacterium]|nr:sulfite exporter TauE/SafE family protein [Betaproteobacteria bacterium]
MEIVPGEIIALAAIAFAGALVFGITGFGAALLTIPLSTFIVPLPFALAMFALLDLSNALRVGFEDPKSAVRREWLRMGPLILAGTVTGITLLVNLPRKAAMLALAAFVIAMAVSTFMRGGSLRTVAAGWAYVAGFAGGITSTLFGAGGPPYAIYLSRRGLTKEQYRATLGRCAMLSISMRVIAFLLSGLLLDARVWVTALFVLPVSWLGINVATRLFRAMSRDLLMRIVALVLLATGVSLAIRASLISP